MTRTELPRVLAARYRLDAVLGEGGMGVVYRGFDLTIERAIAVKLLHGGSSNPDEAKRLMREVRAAAKVKSPCSVTVFDVGETEEGDPFLVMDFVSGETLASVLDRERALPAARAIAIALHVAEALAAAHAAGLVHRDVKPSNIMLSPSPSGEKVTVLDFGIAKLVDGNSALTGEGVLVGTLHYMAPEQISGGAVDGRADQYALAATIMRMIAGEDLFPGADLANVVHHQLIKVPAPLTTRTPTAPKALEAALARALEKEPARRYPDILAFSVALRGALTPGHEAATPVSGAPRDHDLEVADDAPELELAPLPLPIAQPTPLLQRPLSLARARAPSPPHEESWRETLATTLLAPAIWKRVLGYSALALLVGNACFQGFSRTSTLELLAAAVLGGGALLLRAWMSRSS